VGKQAPSAAGGPTRRTVLVTALAAAGGVAASRLLGLRDLGQRRVASALDAAAMDPMADAMTGDEMGMPMDPSAIDPTDMPMAAAEPTPQPTAAPAAAPTRAPTAGQEPITGVTPPDLATGLDWVSPLDKESARIAHLLRRMTLGVSVAELDRAMSDGYARTVARLVDTPPAEPPVLAAAENATGSAAVKLGDLQSWWVDWILKSPTPAAEALTLFWHGHFTSDYRKVGLNNPFMYWQNLTWRHMSLGKLADMLYQVTIDPAMLRYLDLLTSTGRSPNENFARELLELFAMGVGNYTEDDVKAAAKALAGWRQPQTQAMVDARLAALAKQKKPLPSNPPKPDAVKTGVFEPTRAFTGQLLFLGMAATFDARKLIDRILTSDATATFITRKLLTYFATPSPSASWVARLATNYRRSGYETRALVREMLLSPEFTAPETYRVLVKSPTEYTISAAKAVGSQALTRTILSSSSGLGQTLFDPPSVGGWGENANWISSNTMLQRANFVSTALGQMRALPPATGVENRLLDGVLGPRTAAELAATKDDRRRWYVILASPEFQLK
jgi:uncharacterized protein (DUF1800 family)